MSTTTTQIQTEPQAVTAKVTYTIPPPDGSKSYVTSKTDPVTGEFIGNWVKEHRDTVIENVRGKEDQYTLDGVGFQFNREPAKYTSFENDEQIKEKYYPETIDLYKRLTGASRIVIFDHTVRRRRPGQVGSDATNRQPAAQAHIDQTEKASIARVHLHLPAEEVPGLLQKRFQIINLWRPIANQVLEWPLALCDYNTFDVEKDIVPIALIYPDREGEIIGVRHNANHRWKYLRGMTTDEIILIKCYDSKPDVTTFAAHTSFDDPSSPPDAPLRESIEVRALVFYD